MGRDPRVDICGEVTLLQGALQARFMNGWSIALYTDARFLRTLNKWVPREIPKREVTACGMYVWCVFYLLSHLNSVVYSPVLFQIRGAKNDVGLEIACMILRRSLHLVESQCWFYLLLLSSDCRNVFFLFSSNVLNRSRIPPGT